LPNAWGFYDMHGNVREWRADYDGSYPSGDVTDPTGSATGGSHVQRGGSWFYSSGGCRSAYRLHLDPGSTFYGFRLALAPVPAR
jgi:formylglycine-generating enzyme required for sulfatase activity